MSTNKNTLKGVIAALCVLTTAALTRADSFSFIDGSTVEASISNINGDTVVLKLSDDSEVEKQSSSFSPDSLALVQDWKQKNPEFVDVYETWDEKPVVLRSKAAVTPPALCTQGFKGIVNLYVTLDESGKVIHSNVSKSTHKDLEDAAQDAIKDWQFKPAKIAGQSVKAKIAISFQFKA